MADETPHGIGDIPFVAAARLELDELLDQLIKHIRDVQKTQGRLRGLLRANLAVAQGVDLEAVLSHIVTAAKDLVDARYAALGVIEDGHLVRFLHDGMSSELVSQIGDLPQGKGLLGELVEDPRPVRLPEIARHEASAGFPAGHPPMQSFLGVPIRIRDRVFGNLYLTEKQGAQQFSKDDEEVVTALAAAAGIAIENATLFADAQRRRDWQAAMTTVTTDLLEGADGNRALNSLLVRSTTASAADGAAFTTAVLDKPEEITIAAALGLLQPWHGSRHNAVGTLSEAVLASREPLLIADVRRDPGSHRLPEAAADIGSLMIAPVIGDRGTHGVLTLARHRNSSPFTTADLLMMADFAAHAALVLDISELRRDTERIRILEDRDRIAVDLQQTVIRNLFTLGLSLQSTSARVNPESARDAIRAQADEVDRIIRAIRGVVFPTASLDTTTEP